MSEQEILKQLEEQKKQIKENLAKLQESRKEIESIWEYIKRGGLFNPPKSKEK